MRASEDQLRAWMIGGLKGGRYLLRVEPQFGKEASGRLPDTVHVEVIRGPFRGGPAWFVIVALLLWPLITVLRALLFEKRRWQESDHPMVQSS